MLPKWLDGRAAAQFGEEIADDVRRVIPLEASRIAKNPAKRLQKLMRVVEKTSSRSAQHPLNIYQKAKFANALRWSLKDSGYTADFVDEVVTLILARM